MQVLENLEVEVIRAIETIELLRMERQELLEEIESLKAENGRLTHQQGEWEAKMTALLGQLTNASSEEEQTQEDHSEQVA